MITFLSHLPRRARTRCILLSFFRSLSVGRAHLVDMAPLAKSRFQRAALHKDLSSFGHFRPTTRARPTLRDAGQLRQVTGDYQFTVTPSGATKLG